MREVVAEFERPVLLFSGGKDSIVMLRLAREGVRARPASRSRSCTSTPGTTSPRCWSTATSRVAELGLQLVVASVPEAMASGLVREPADGTRNRIQTPVLLDAVEKYRFDALFGGARRDEEKARAKERVFSFRDEFGQWDPKNQRPELWSLYNGRHHPGESIRVFPLSNWTELDIWHYIARERIDAAVDLLRARARGGRARRHALRGQRVHPRPGRRDAVRGSGCATAPSATPRCTAAVRSDADTVEKVIEEVAATRITERGATRGDDKVSEAAMEDRKREGYF